MSSNSLNSAASHGGVPSAVNALRNSFVGRKSSSFALPAALPFDEFVGGAGEEEERGEAGTAKIVNASLISVSWAAVRLFSFASLEGRGVGFGVVDGGAAAVGARRFGGCDGWRGVS